MHGSTLRYTGDYPILQSKVDDDYYMDHTVDDKEGLPGAIMTEYSYNPDPFESDAVTVVYGHNMLNDSFFSRLKDYQDETFRQEHPYIEIYTPEHIYKYRVFAAVTYDNRHILYNYNCRTKEGYQAFLDSLSEVRIMPTWIEDPLPVTTDDRMIVLSTCNGNHDERFLICAVLTGNNNFYEKRIKKTYPVHRCCYTGSSGSCDRSVCAASQTAAGKGTSAGGIHFPGRRQYH